MRNALRARLHSRTLSAGASGAPAGVRVTHVDSARQPGWAALRPDDVVTRLAGFDVSADGKIALPSPNVTRQPHAQPAADAARSPGAAGGVGEPVAAPGLRGGAAADAGKSSGAGGEREVGGGVEGTRLRRWHQRRRGVEVCLSHAVSGRQVGEWVDVAVRREGHAEELTLSVRCALLPWDMVG